MTTMDAMCETDMALYRPTPAAVASRHPAGMTLLEVLVACGVLVLGLSGIAALLAAVSSLVSEAAGLDQTATLVANAHAEIHNRQICSLQAFQSGTTLPGVRTACLGELQQQLSSISSIASSAAVTSAPLLPPTAYVSTRADGPEIGAYRSFRSEDRLQYGTGTNGLPVATMAGGTLAHDSLQRTCWGGLLTLVDFLDTPVPVTFSRNAVPHPFFGLNSTNRFRGLPARLDVTIFKKPASVDAPNAVLLLTQAGGPCMFQLSGGADIQLAPSTDASFISKAFLRGCSFVLALPPVTGSMPGVLPSGTSGPQSLAVLDRWDGEKVDGCPSGLRLQDKFLASGESSNSRLFYRVASGSSGSAQFSQAQIVSIFGCANTLTDGPGTRTKTVEPYTIRLPTLKEAPTVLQSAPAGKYWTSTRRLGTSDTMWVYDKAAGSAIPPVPGESYAVALEVAVSPTWYRIQTSWPITASTSSASTFPVTVIISDSRVYEFPVDATSKKLRVAAFQGLMAVESTYLVLE